MAKAINLSSLQGKELVAGSTGEKLSVATSVSDAFQLSRLLVHRETIAPGRKTAPLHRHTTKEEVFIVESGNPSICLGDQVQKLRPGDAIGLKPGDGSRMIYNDSAEDAVVWTIGTNEDNDIVEILEARDIKAI